MLSLEYIIEICVAVDIAIMGIAYPIIVDKISNIGDKYSSQYIALLFDNEFPQTSIKLKFKKHIYQLSFFKFFLYATIISFLFLILKTEPLFGWDNWFINNSAKLIVLASTIVLTILFFIWLDKVFFYNGKSTSLLKRIIFKYNSLKNDTEIKLYHLKSINELTFYAIEKQDEHLQKTLLEFYYREFSSIRKEHNKTIPLIYPVDLYLLVNRLHVELIHSQNKKLPAIEHRAVSGSWLLGDDFESIIISEQTYGWLWRNIYIICEKEKFIKMYWANASQYFDYRLPDIIPNLGFQINEIENASDIEKRQKEKTNFLEFHYALGGLLLYRGQYKTIKYIFQYSQSQPPRYPLLPNHMTEIFIWFENFRNEFKVEETPLETKYYFPELDNLGNSRQMIFWACSYLSLLFIRQYTLHTYYTYENHTALPHLPDDVTELNNWLDTTSYFEYCLYETIENQELITSLKWNELVKNNKPKFKLFISDLKDAIKDKIGEQKLNAPLSIHKISTFRDSTNQIISSAFKAYSNIFITITEEEKDKDMTPFLSGGETLMDKAAFTNKDFQYFNYDIVFANQIAKNSIYKHIPNSFLASSTRSYLLNKENILTGIEKIIGTNNNVVIVAISISYDLKTLLQNSRFSHLVRYIPASAMEDTLFVLDAANLPAIEYKDLSPSEIAEYHLLKINNEFKIYISIIDINTKKNKGLIDKWSIKKDLLDLKVQVAIAFRSVIYWRKDRDIIQLKLATKFKEQGIQSNINEIESL